MTSKMLDLPASGYRLYSQQEFEVLRSIPDNSIDCVWTDPPYLLSNGGISFQAGKVTSVDKGKWDRSLGLEADLAFHRAWVQECWRVLKPHGTLWASGTLHAYPLFGYAMTATGFRILNDIVWEKPNPPPNVSRSRFVYSHEMLLWAVKPAQGRLGHIFDHEAMRLENGGRPMRTVWRLKPADRSEKESGSHPTQKPLALVRRCLIASTKAGQVVLDPFMGSGTTGVAALLDRRRFIGIEREADFLQLADDRIAKVIRDQRLSSDEDGPSQEKRPFDLDRSAIRRLS